MLPTALTFEEKAGERIFRVRVEFSALLTSEEHGMAAESLRLFESPEEPETKTQLSELEPVGYRPTGSNSETPRVFDPESPATDDVDAVLDQLMRDASATEVVTFSEAEAQAASKLTLAEYFAEYFGPWRMARLEKKLLKKAQFKNEERAVRQFAEWDAANPPAGWPEHLAWKGFPIRHLRGDRIQDYYRHQAAGHWAWGTCNSNWDNLRIVLGNARNRGAIPTVPEIPKFAAAIRETLTDAGVDPDDENVAAFSDDELAALYQVIPAVVEAGLKDGTIKSRSPLKLKKLARSIVRELQACIVLGANCGPRPEDLLMLQFREHVKLDDDIPHLRYRARKTEKLHRAPFAPCVVDHLRRLQKAHGQFAQLDTFLFPNLINPHVKAPMDSAAKRRATSLMKAAITAIGLDADNFRTPFHSLRKSCTTRLNATGIAHGDKGAGSQVTHGKSADVASQHYDKVLPTIAKAVELLPQPECWA